MNIPVSKNLTPCAIDRWHEEHHSGTPRPYMGVSMIGHKCDRYLWLKFRWAVSESFSGRMLRLFARGQAEEQRFTDDLKRIGCIVTHTGDDQVEVDFGLWVRGHADGIIESGLPEAPKTRHVVEFKTHNDRSFQELLKKGVKEAKPMHWAQMQCYMLGLKTDRALYMAVNKNDDTLYTERVRLDRSAAEDIVRRGQDIATDVMMPEGISKDPEWWECKICPCHDFCHVTRQTKELNCRTCRHFRTEDGIARCDRFRGMIIPDEYQPCACEDYDTHPDLGKERP